MVHLLEGGRLAVVRSACRGGRRRRRVGAAVALVLLGGAIGAAPSQAATDPRYVLVGEWKSGDGRMVQLRQGYVTNSAGFGLATLERHNLTARSAQVVTQHPDFGFPIKVSNAPDTWNYGATVAHVQCSGRSVFHTCQITEKVRVIVGVDFRPIDRAGNSRGVITGLCQGYDGTCPDWVRNAANG